MIVLKLSPMTPKMIQNNLKVYKRTVGYQYKNIIVQPPRCISCNSYLIKSKLDDKEYYQCSECGKIYKYNTYK